MTNVGKINLNFNNITELLPTIDRLRIALKKSSGNDFHLIQNHFGPLIEIFDAVSLKHFLFMKFRATRYFKVSPFFNLTVLQFMMMKKHLCTAKLFNLATKQAINGIDILISKDYANSIYSHRHLTFANFVIKFIYTTVSSLIFVLLNSPDSPFVLSNVFDHIKFLSANVYIFYVKPILQGSDERLQFIFEQGRYLIFSNLTTLMFDFAIFAIIASIIYGFIVLFCPIYFRNPILTNLNRLKRSGVPIYDKLPNSIPVSVLFFVRRFCYFYLNYGRIFDAAFFSESDSFQPRRKFRRTRKAIYWFYTTVVFYFLK